MNLCVRTMRSLSAARRNKCVSVHRPSEVCVPVSCDHSAADPQHATDLIGRTLHYPRLAPTDPLLTLCLSHTQRERSGPSLPSIIHSFHHPFFLLLSNSFYLKILFGYHPFFIQPSALLPFLHQNQNIFIHPLGNSSTPSMQILFSSHHRTFFGLPVLFVVQLLRFQPWLGLHHLVIFFFLLY